MYPILYQYGSFVITSFGVFLTLSFIVFLFSIQWFTLEKKLSMSFITKHIFSLTLLPILGAKILFWLCEFQLLSGTVVAFFAREDYYGIFRTLFNSEEFYVAGGLITFFTMIYFYTKKHGEPFFQWLDILTISLLHALCVGYIGAFLGGYFVGSETQSFLGMIFSGDPKYSFATQLYTVAIHPIQLYSLIITLVITIVLRALIKRINVDGAVGILGIGLYSIQVFLIEFFRGNDNMFRIGLTLNQYIALGSIIISIYILLRKLPKIELIGKQSSLSSSVMSQEEVL